MTSDTPFIVPDLPHVVDLIDDVRAITESGRFSNFGTRERAFAEALAAAVGGGTTAVTFSSATTALEVAVLATVGRADPGDVILMPSFTFAAAGHVVMNLGYRPAFVDVEPGGMQPDPADGRELLNGSPGPVRAILLAQSFGIGSPHVAEWEGIAADAGVPLIIDSAAGLGGRHEDGRPIGANGTCEVFSFHATKPLAIGEGGALLTRDPVLAERARRVSNFGFDPEGLVVGPGVNGKLAELPAAIGLRQLARLAAVVEGRREIFDRYRAVLPARMFLRGTRDSPLAFLPVLLDAGRDAAAVVENLAAIGVGARRYYHPALHRHPYFGDVSTRALPVTDDVAPRMLSLPCHSGVTPGVVAGIAEVVGR